MIRNRTGIVNQSFSVIAAPVFTALASTVIGTPDAIQTSGYREPGDGGGGFYVNVGTSVPTDIPASAYTSINGAYYELQVAEVSPTMLGGTGYTYDPDTWTLGSAAGKTDSYQAIMDAFDYAAARNARVEDLNHIFVCRTYIELEAGYNRHIGRFLDLDMSESTTITVASGKNLIYMRGETPTVIGNIQNQVDQFDNFVAIDSTVGLAVGDQIRVVNDDNMISQSANFARKNQWAEVRDVVTASATITNITWSTGVCTVTTGSAHGIAVGSRFSLTGNVQASMPSAANGTFTAVTGTTGSTLKFDLTDDPGAFLSYGTLTNTVVFDREMRDSYRTLRNLLTVEWSGGTVTGFSWSGGEGTITTSAAHNVAVGRTFSMSGNTTPSDPDALNATFVAITGTAGSTLKFDLADDPGSLTVNGVVDGLLTATTATASGITEGQEFTIVGADPDEINGTHEAAYDSGGALLTWLADDPGTTVDPGQIDFRPRLLLLDSKTRWTIDGKLVVRGAGGSPAGETTVWQRAIFSQLCFGSSYGEVEIYNCERGGWSEDGCIGLRGGRLKYHGCANWYLSSYPGSFSGCSNYDMGDIDVSRCRHGHTSNSSSPFEDFGEWWGDDKMGGQDAHGVGMWAGLIDTHPGVGITTWKKVYCEFNTDATPGSSIAVFSQGAGFHIDFLEVRNGKSAAAGFQPYGCRRPGYKLAATLNGLQVDAADIAVYLQNLTDRDLGGTSQDAYLTVNNVFGAADQGYRTSPSEGNCYLFGVNGDLTVDGEECVRCIATEDYKSEIRVTNVRFNHLSDDIMAVVADSGTWSGSGFGASVWLTDCRIDSPNYDTVALADDAQINAWNTLVTTTGAAVYSTSGTGEIHWKYVGGAASFSTGSSPLPTFTFATPGDLSLVYTEQTCTWTLIEDEMHFESKIACTPTFTTGTGSIRLSLPQAAASPSRAIMSAYASSGVTWPVGRTMLQAECVSGQDYVLLAANGSAVSTSYLSNTSVVSGAAIAFTYSGNYKVDT